MPLNVISNFAANVAHRHLAMSDAEASNSVAKLSAGTRVLSAKDDAASLAIGSRLKAEVSALQQAQVLCDVHLRPPPSREHPSPRRASARRPGR